MQRCITIWLHVATDDEDVLFSPPDVVPTSRLEFGTFLTFEAARASGSESHVSVAIGCVAGEQEEGSSSQEETH